MSPKITAWAVRHKVSLEALYELNQIFGIPNHALITVNGEIKSEAYVQSLVRLEAANKGVQLFRNNVGVLKDEKGRPVRYGLANDSKQLNEKIKSSDLIGWRPINVSPQHVGSTIAQFVAIECKEPDWQFTGDDREVAQLAFLQLLTNAGGFASFATGVIDFD